MSEQKPIVRKQGGYAHVKCPYCGAEYRVPETVSYATCPYCGTTFKLDKPGEKIEHFLFKMQYDKNDAFRIAKEIGAHQVGVVEDLADAASFDSAKLYYVPVYIYEINIKTPCKGEKEEVNENGEIDLSIHGGEEVGYTITPALRNLPIPLPPNYGFPARARMYFKPTVLKNGVYLQPELDPYQVFEEIKKPSLRQAIEEAKIACPEGYDIIDKSRYLGIAHYPFWLITYTYQGQKYQALVDAADGTLVYLEYPLSMKGRVSSLTGGIASMIGGAIIGLIAGVALGGPLYGLIGGLMATLPGGIMAASKIFKSKETFKFKPGEEGLYMLVR